MSADSPRFRRNDRCPLCQSTVGRVVGLRTNVSLSASVFRQQPRASLSTWIRWCPACDFYYCEVVLDSGVEETYGDASAYFGTIPVDEQRMAWYDGVVTEIGKHLRGEGRLLDVGCGRGELVYTATRLGWEAYGVDANPAFVAFAKERFGLANLVVARDGDLPFEPGTFDAISLNAVLEHMADPQRVLRQVHQLLRLGGVLYVEVPNESVLRFRAMDVALRLIGSHHTTHLSPFTSPYHINGFTPKSIRCALQQAGYELATLRLQKGLNRFPVVGSLRRALIRLAYGSLIAVENLSRNRYNIRVYARRPVQQSST